MRRLHRSVLGIVALLGVPAVTVAQDLPPATDLVARHVEAIGGRDAVLRAPGYHVTGRLEVPAQGISGDYESFAAPPNRIVLMAEIPGLGATGGGFDGETGWSINPATGPMLLEGRMLEQMRHIADFHSALHTPEHIASMETVEAADFEGMPCYRVRVVTTWGEEYSEFFHRETGLLVGSVRMTATPLGELEATTLYQEYQDVDGVRLPAKTVQRIMGFDQIFQSTSMTALHVPDSAFALPPEIQTLVGAR